MKINPVRAHVVTYFETVPQPFSTALGHNLGDGTYGSLTVIFKARPGALFIQCNTYEALEWWTSYCRGHVDVEKMWVTPAVDQYDTGETFEPPDLSWPDLIPR